MNLKQKTFVVVALSVGILLFGYLTVARYYIAQQEARFYSARQGMADTLSQEFNEFLKRGVDRLSTIAELPSMIHYVQNLAETREEGRQIAAWTTLHYMFY